MGKVSAPNQSLSVGEVLGGIERMRVSLFEQQICPDIKS